MKNGIKIEVVIGGKTYRATYKISHGLSTSPSTLKGLILRGNLTSMNKIMSDIDADEVASVIQKMEKLDG